MALFVVVMPDFGASATVLESEDSAGAFSPASCLSSRRGPVAQLAEQQTLNLRVEGSIPSRLTSFL